MPSIIPKAYEIYRSAGYEILSGFSPYHFFDYRDAPFTIFLQGNKLVGCPGLAVQEAMFLENFRDYIAPRRILVIGNAYGWSTIVTALTFPNAKTVAIDIDAEGVKLTNTMIDRHQLSARAVVAKSPDGVADVVQHELGGPIDFCFIDADHHNPALIADFAATRAVAASDAVYLLHDVINWHLIDAVKQIETQHRLASKLLTRTASGMAIIHAALKPDFEAYLNCFSDPPQRYHGLRQYYLTNFTDPIAPFMTGYTPKER